MNVLIVCANGISSGLLAMKIAEELENCGVGGTCVATSQLDIENMLDGKDYVLVGPQLRIMFDVIKKQINDRVPVSLIDSIDYGTMNTKSIVSKVLKELDK